VDGLLSVLANEIGDHVPRKVKPTPPNALPDRRTLDSLLDTRMLDTIAERIACRILSVLTTIHLDAARRADDDGRGTAAAHVVARQ
jgi:hypothetical protein